MTFDLDILFLVAAWVVAFGGFLVVAVAFGAGGCRHEFTNRIKVSGYGLTEYEVWFCKHCPEVFGRQTRNFN